MPINKISSSDFADTIIEGVSDRDPSLDTRIGPIRDLFIDPISEVLEQQNNRVWYVSNLLSLKYANKILPDDLNDLVFNEGIIRWEGSRSITTVTFSRANPPISDIVVPINFPLATDADPQTGSSVVFKTIETQTMFSASPSAYYNSETGKYELNVQAASVVKGEETSVGAYTITNFRRPLAGFDEVFNVEATSSGRGLETNGELANRYRLHVKGTSIGTPAGLDRYILDNFSNVSDVYVVYGNNQYLTRQDDDAGAVDVWLLASVPASATYDVEYSGVETLIELPNQPVIDITSVVDGGGTSYTEGTDFELVTGETEYSYSNEGSDGIKFLITASAVPNIGDVLTIMYRYNSMIPTLASWFTQSEYYTMGNDTLFRWAQQKDIAIEAQLKVKSGSPSSVLESVRTAITNYINELKLGENVEEFDVDSVVAQIFGVDNFTWVKLAEKGSSGVADITVEPNKYARIGSTDLIITLV